jgi:hypothetical protein
MTLPPMPWRCQVSVATAWSPNDVDGRAYDVRGLAQAADFLYGECRSSLCVSLCVSLSLTLCGFIYQSSV